MSMRAPPNSALGVTCTKPADAPGTLEHQAGLCVARSAEYFPIAGGKCRVRREARRESDHRGRAPRVRKFERHGSAVSLNHAARRSEAESSSPMFGREEGLEQPRLHVGRHARPRIDDAQLMPGFPGLRRHLDLAFA